MNTRIVKVTRLLALAMWLAAGVTYVERPVRAFTTCDELGCYGCDDPEGVDCRSCATIGGAVCLKNKPAGDN